MICVVVVVVSRYLREKEKAEKERKQKREMFVVKEREESPKICCTLLSSEVVSSVTAWATPGFTFGFWLLPNAKKTPAIGDAEGVFMAHTREVRPG
jgi:hypothetical protein